MNPAAPPQPLLHRLRRILKTLGGLPRHRAFTGILVAVNGVGSLWGFAWYRPQLAATPPWQWGVVPDSPTASSLFTAVLVLLWRGGRAPWLEAFAYLTMIKYGLWTVVVLGGYGLRTGYWDGEGVLLILSHAGMAIEATLYLRHFPPAKAGVVLAWLWALGNDLADYIGGLHPALPGPEVYHLAMVSALSLTFLAGLVVARAAIRGRPPAALGGDLPPGPEASA